MFAERFLFLSQLKSKKQIYVNLTDKIIDIYAKSKNKLLLL